MSKVIHLPTGFIWSYANIDITKFDAVTGDMVNCADKRSCDCDVCPFDSEYKMCTQVPLAIEQFEVLDE